MMPHRRASAGEILCALVALSGVLCVQVLFVAGKIVFDRPLWIDEVMTQGFASAPSIKFIVAALHNGAETHLPTAFVLMRWFCVPFGGPTPTALRIFSFTSVILGLAGLYAALRLAFDWQAAAIAVLAVWSHHLVIRHAFDARFYGPMFAGATWFAYLLLGSRSSNRAARFRTAAAAVAIFLFTVHYFGCLCAGLVILFDWILNRRSWRCMGRDLLTVLPATIALLICVPLYIGQRHAFRATTWVPPATLGDIEIFLVAIFPAITIVTIVGFWWISSLIPSHRSDAPSSPPSDIAGLFGLAFMFVPIVLLSFTMQNFMINRYGIVTMAGLAPPLALMVSQISSRLRIALVVALLGISCSGLMGIAKADAAFGRFVQSRIELIKNLPPDAQAVFMTTDEAYSLDAAAPDLKNRVSVIGFDPLADETQKPAPIFAIEAAQNFSRYFGFPNVVSRQDLAATPHFFLLGPLPDVTLLQQDFPIHSVHLLNPTTAELTIESGK